MRLVTHARVSENDEPREVRKSGSVQVLKLGWGEQLWSSYVWLVVWNMFCVSIYGEESSPLTFIFFRGVETTNQWLFFDRKHHEHSDPCRQTYMEI